MDQDRRSKTLIKQNAKSRFMTKEYSRPVQSANELAYRKRQKILDNINDDMRVYSSKYIRERGNLEYFRRKLSVISINYDADRFKPSKLERSKSASASRYEDADDIVKSLPSDCALDFGPGNRMLVFTNKSKPTYASNMRKINKSSSYSTRPKTTAGGFSRGKNFQSDLGFGSNKPGLRQSDKIQNAHSGSKPGLTRNFSTMSQTKGSRYVYSDSEDDDESCDTHPSRFIENYSEYAEPKGNTTNNDQKLKSFHLIRKEHTYAEGEYPDAYRDRLNWLKMSEKRTFNQLQTRIQKFYKEIKPLRNSLGFSIIAASSNSSIL